MELHLKKFIETQLQELNLILNKYRELYRLDPTVLSRINELESDIYVLNKVLKEESISKEWEETIKRDIKSDE